MPLAQSPGFGEFGGGAVQLAAERIGRGEVDLLRKSGEFPVSNEELDETATTVYKGI
jgi:hypothetical protein